MSEKKKQADENTDQSSKDYATAIVDWHLALYHSYFAKAFESVKSNQSAMSNETSSKSELKEEPNAKRVKVPEVPIEAPIIPQDMATPAALSV